MSADDAQHVWVCGPCGTVLASDPELMVCLHCDARYRGDGTRLWPVTVQCVVCGAQIPWHADGTVPRHIDRGRTGECAAYLDRAVDTVSLFVRPVGERSLQPGDVVVVHLHGQEPSRVRVVDAVPTEHGVSLTVERAEAHVYAPEEVEAAAREGLRRLSAGEPLNPRYVRGEGDTP